MSKSLESLKAARLRVLRQELGYLVTEQDPQSRVWRQGLIEGRLLELKALGVFDQDDFEAFNHEFSNIVTPR